MTNLKQNNNNNNNNLLQALKYVLIWHVFPSYQLALTPFAPRSSGVHDEVTIDLTRSQAFSHSPNVENCQKDLQICSQPS